MGGRADRVNGQPALAGLFISVTVFPRLVQDRDANLALARALIVDCAVGQGMGAHGWRLWGTRQCPHTHNNKTQTSWRRGWHCRIVHSGVRSPLSRGATPAGECRRRLSAERRRAAPRIARLGGDLCARLRESETGKATAYR